MPGRPKDAIRHLNVVLPLSVLLAGCAEGALSNLNTSPTRPNPNKTPTTISTPISNITRRPCTITSHKPDKQGVVVQDVVCPDATIEAATSGEATTEGLYMYLRRDPGFHGRTYMPRYTGRFEMSLNDGSNYAIVDVDMKNGTITKAVEVSGGSS